MSHLEKRLPPSSKLNQFFEPILVSIIFIILHCRIYWAFFSISSFLWEKQPNCPLFQHISVYFDSWVPLFLFSSRDWLHFWCIHVLIFNQSFEFLLLCEIKSLKLEIFLNLFWNVCSGWSLCSSFFASWTLRSPWDDWSDIFIWSMLFDFVVSVSKSMERRVLFKILCSKSNLFLECVHQ